LGIVDTFDVESEIYRNTVVKSKILTFDVESERLSPMTLILGAVCTDGVCLVADRKITDVNKNELDYCNKLFGEVKNVIYGASGSVSAFREFRRQIFIEVKEKGGMNHDVFIQRLKDKTK
jgi:20S proteasome alpha/beta subunit